MLISLQFDKGGVNKPEEGTLCLVAYAVRLTSRSLRLEDMRIGVERASGKNQILGL